MLIIKEATSQDDLDKIYAIRKAVFVEEQSVPLAIEIDEHEKNCLHFLGEEDSVPCGCGRIRRTENGVKLERCAILPEFRNSSRGFQLVSSLIKAVKEIPELKNLPIYIHAQFAVQGFYEKLDFKPEGEIFIEANIPHIKMVL